MIDILKKEIYSFLPLELCDIFEKTLCYNDWNCIHEIRINKKGPIICRFNDKTLYISKGLRLADQGDYYITNENLPDVILNRITKGSPYAYISQLCSGYITAKGGHRVGFAGTPVVSDGQVTGIKNISFVNIRICREAYFETDKSIDNIICLKPYKNIMIIAPPKCGKTTFVRYLAKKISSQKQLPSVVVIDERGEIFAQDNGVSSFDTGINTCVLSYINKSKGLDFAVKNLSPDIIICDEISSFSEAEALRNTITAGVSVIFTVHGKNHNDILMSDKYSCLSEYIDYYIELSCAKGAGTIERCAELLYDT